MNSSNTASIQGEHPVTLTVRGLHNKLQKKLEGDASKVLPPTTAFGTNISNGIDSVKSATGQDTLQLFFADATHSGIVSTAAQTFGGVKTFAGNVSMNLPQITANGSYYGLFVSSPNPGVQQILINPNAGYTKGSDSFFLGKETSTSFDVQTTANTGYIVCSGDGVTDGPTGNTTCGRINMISNRPTPTTNDICGSLNFFSKNTPSPQVMSINAELAGNGGVNGFGGKMVFNTKPDNFAGQLTALSLESNQTVRCVSTASADGVSLGSLVVAGGISVAKNISMRGDLIAFSNTSNTAVTISAAIISGVKRVNNVGLETVFTPGASSTTNMQFGTQKTMIFVVSAYDVSTGALCIATYNSSSIIILGDTALIVNSGTPTANQIGVTKADNSNTISVITGSAQTNIAISSLLGSPTFIS